MDTYLELGHVLHFNSQLLLTSVGDQNVLLVADVEGGTLVDEVDGVRRRPRGRCPLDGRAGGCLGHRRAADVQWLDRGALLALGRVEHANVFVQAPIAAPTCGQAILASI